VTTNDPFGRELYVERFDVLPEWEAGHVGAMARAAKRRLAERIVDASEAAGCAAVSFRLAHAVRREGSGYAFKLEHEYRLEVTREPAPGATTAVRHVDLPLSGVEEAAPVGPWYVSFFKRWFR
jgi:hypothetical protein